MKRLIAIFVFLMLVVSLSALDVNLFYTIVNDYRENNGLERLEVDPGLERYATAYVEACIEDGHMVHNLWSLDKVSRVLYQKSDLDYQFIDEIIQEGHPVYMNTEVDVFMNFLSSPPHKAALDREDFETIGAAWQSDEKGIKYFAAYIGDLDE